MSVLKAANLYDIQHAGEYGNASEAYSKLLSTTIVNATDTVDFMTLPAGARLFDWQMITNAFTSGTSPTLSLGWRYANGDSGGSATALLAATSTASAARTRAGATSPIDVDKDIIIYGTGGGTGTSTACVVEVLVSYIARGTK